MPNQPHTTHTVQSRWKVQETQIAWINIQGSTHQFLYLQVLSDLGTPLPPALFSKDVVAGMFITQNMANTASETPLDVLFLSNTEAIIELGERTNMERMITIMTACQWWIGQKVTLQCRVATPDKIEAARTRAAEEEDDHHIPNGNEGDARLFRMMEDIHKLAVSPHGEALRIPTFSGVVSPPKNEAMFAQWIHEVRQALEKFPETTVRNWISRSLRGPPAEIVRSLGPGVTVQLILQKLEMMHGAVYPFNVMMRRVFNITQGKGESVTQFATKLESAISNVQRDHPMQSAHVNLRNSMRDPNKRKINREEVRRKEIMEKLISRPQATEVLAMDVVELDISSETVPTPERSL